VETNGNLHGLATALLSNTTSVLHVNYTIFPWKPHGGLGLDTGVILLPHPNIVNNNIRSKI